MKYDEFAFTNQQLAGMLRTGIPLEGALRQLCATMRGGTMRREFELLEADLAKGTPLTQALGARKLPELYTRMLQVGVESNDLPGTLTLLADYYQKMSLLWTRLKAVMIYPVIVLVASFCLTLFLFWIFQRSGFQILERDIPWMTASQPLWASNPYARDVCLLLPSVVLLMLIGVIAAAILAPPLRRRLIWVLPGFRDASLSRFASSLGLMLKSGCSLKTALALVRSMESGSPMAKELANWECRIAQGSVKFSDLAGGGKVVPPLFVWMVAADGDDWEPGLARAAELYYSRAVYQADLLLNCALPVSVIFIGALVATQMITLIHFGGLIRALNSMGGM